MGEVVIVAHADADGIVSAAIISVAEDLSVDKRHVHFVHPSLLHKVLRKVDPPSRLYVLDLALDQQNRSAVFQELERLSKAGSELVYVDHHLMTRSDLKTIKEISNLTLYRTTGLSTSQLASKLVRTRFNLGDEEISIVKRLATLGGIADRCIRPRTHEMRRETLILDESWRASPLDNNFRRFLVQELRSGNMPSQIPEAVENYKKAIKIRQQSIETIEDAIFYSGDILLVSKPDVELHGHVGPALSEISNRRDKITVGLFKPADANYTVVCARAPDQYSGPAHLGKILLRMCVELGGSGGGHRLAAGGRIAVNGEERFIEMLKREVGESS